MYHLQDHIIEKETRVEETIPGPAQLGFGGEPRKMAF